jgi:hypothetical protein
MRIQWALTLATAGVFAGQSLSLWTWLRSLAIVLARRQLQPRAGVHGLIFRPRRFQPDC